MWIFSHLGVCVCLPPPGYGPSKGALRTVQVAGVHAARMIRPMHPNTLSPRLRGAAHHRDHQG